MIRLCQSLADRLFPPKLDIHHLKTSGIWIGWQVQRASQWGQKPRTTTWNVIMHTVWLMLFISLVAGVFDLQRPRLTSAAVPPGTAVKQWMAIERILDVITWPGYMMIGAIALLFIIPPLLAPIHYVRRFEIGEETVTFAPRPTSPEVWHILQRADLVAWQHMRNPDHNNHGLAIIWRTDPASPEQFAHVMMCGEAAPALINNFLQATRDAGLDLPIRDPIH